MIIIIKREKFFFLINKVYNYKTRHCFEVEYKRQNELFGPTKRVKEINSYLYKLNTYVTSLNNFLLNKFLKKIHHQTESLYVIDDYVYKISY